MTRRVTLERQVAVRRLARHVIEVQEAASPADVTGACPKAGADARYGD